VVKGGAVILTLAFSMQTKTSFWNTKRKSYFNMTLFEGGPRCQTKSYFFLFWR
jgi:hypothetical protein